MTTIKTELEEYYHGTYLKENKQDDCFDDEKSFVDIGMLELRKRRGLPRTEVCFILNCRANYKYSILLFSK